MGLRKIIYFLPLSFLLAVVFMLSSQPRSQQSIIPFLSRHFHPDLLASMLPDVHVHYGNIYLEAKRSPYQFLELVFRKCAHIILYTSIGLALYSAAFGLQRGRHSPLFRWLCVMAGIVVIAAMDEWNQSRVPMRSGLMLDVWLDLIGGTMGAAAVIWLVRLITRIRRNRRDIRAPPFQYRKPKG